MAKRTPQQKSNPVLQEIRSRLKVLKSKGLYKGDLRKPLTRYAIRKAQQPEYVAVATGQATVRTAKSAKKAREYSGVFTVQGKKIILPAEHKQARFNKAGELVERGAPLPKARKVGRFKEGQMRSVVVHTPGGSRAIFRADNSADVGIFLQKYSHLDKYEVTIELDDWDLGE